MLHINLYHCITYKWNTDMLMLKSLLTGYSGESGVLMLSVY